MIPKALETKRDEFVQSFNRTHDSNRNLDVFSEWSFHSGFNAACEILLPLIKNNKEAFEYYIKNCEPLMYQYVGEYPHGGSLPFPIEWKVAEEALAKIESVLGEDDDTRKP